MDYGFFRRAASNQNVIYKRSVYSFGGKFSMTESEIRNELKGTLDDLDPDKKDKGKHRLNVGATFGLWEKKQRVAMVAVFVMYFVLALPCTYHLVQKHLQHSQIGKMLGNMREVVNIQQTALVIARKMECSICLNVMDDDEECSSVCVKQPHQEEPSECMNTGTGDFLELFSNTSNLENSQYFHKVLSSIKDCLESSVSLLKQNVPFSHKETIEAIKTIKAAYLLIKQSFTLSLSCGRDLKHVRVDTVIRDLNYVVANLNSSFIISNHEAIFRRIIEFRYLIFPLPNSEVFNVEPDDHDDVTLMEVCNPTNVTDILKIPVAILGHIQNFVGNVRTETKSDFQASTIEIVAYTLVLFMLFIICFFEYFQVKKVLSQMVDLKYDSLLVTLCLNSEEEEFREVMLELVPESRMSEALQGEVDEGILPLFKGNKMSEDRKSSDYEKSISSKKSKEREVVSEILGVKKNSRLAMTTIAEEKDYEIPEHVIERQHKKSTNYIQEVTVFQSEIAGFNRMLQHITPAQLINLVSYLIKLFDERVRLYDVFTISREMNAYTVVSGITAEQSSRHASEIINMALDIRAVTGDLEFEKGLQDSKLRLKIGIHTDSCFERLKTFPKPRYFISGDVLDVTQKLRMSSPPSGIHVSETTQQILSRNIAYNLQKYSHVLTNCHQSIRSYLVVGRKVSEDIKLVDCPGRRTAVWTPIQLEQKALYRFESEEIKYVAPVNWMIPSTSYQSPRSTVMSRTSFISDDSGRYRPYISHEMVYDSSD